MQFAMVVQVLRWFFVLVAFVVSIVVFVGNITQDSPLNKLYFLKVNTTDLTPTLRPKPLNDWYTVGLWNYCRGHSGSSDPIECSSPNAAFQFNPVEVFGFNTTTGKTFLNPHKARNATALDDYQDAYRWLFASYIGTIAATGAAALMNSCVKAQPIQSALTSIITAFAAVCAIGGAVAAQTVFSKLEDYINHDMLRHGSGIGRLHASLGTPEFALAWIAGAAAAISFPLSLLLLVVWLRDRKQREKKERWPDYVPPPTENAPYPPYPDPKLPPQVSESPVDPGPDISRSQSAESPLPTEGPYPMVDRHPYYRNGITPDFLRNHGRLQETPVGTPEPGEY